MPRPEPAAFLTQLTAAMAAAAQAPDLEAAFAPLTEAAQSHLGDPDAARRPGGLRPGERDYRIGGVFLITPDRRCNMLVAGRGFPPEQRRLAIPLDWNHPGEVVRTGRPILVANTDEDVGFRQFLRTSRMGASLYHPIHTPAGLIGQIVAAAQARHSYDATDLDRLGALAQAASLVWQARAGADWLAADYPAPDLWRAEDH